jgi:5-methylcytosine-specific restriction endonuclease McrA
MQNPDWVLKRRDNHKKVDARRRTPERLAIKRALEVRRLTDPSKAERHRQTSSAFQKNNKSYVKARKALRRAREANAEGAWSAADFAAILARQSNACFYCSADIAEHHHADHYIPLARGGSNWPSNIVAACADCNHRKRDKLPEEFIGRRKSRLPPPLIQTRCSDDSAPARSLDQFTYAPPGGRPGWTEPTESAPIA